MCCVCVGSLLSLLALGAYLFSIFHFFTCNHPVWESIGSKEKARRYVVSAVVRESVWMWSSVSSTADVSNGATDDGSGTKIFRFGFMLVSFVIIQYFCCHTSSRPRELNSTPKSSQSASFEWKCRISPIHFVRMKFNLVFRRVHPMEIHFLHSISIEICCWFYHCVAVVANLHVNRHRFFSLI